MQKLTSKQRVQKVFNLEVPDRVPINYSGNPDITRRMMEHFNTKNYHDFIYALGVDIRGIGPEYKGPRLHPERPDRRVDPQYGSVTRWVEHAAGGYYDFCDFPLKDADEEEIANYPMPDPDDYDYEQILGWLDKFEGYAVHAGGAGTGDILNSNGFLRSPEQVIYDIADDNPAGMLLSRRRMDIEIKKLERTLDIARGRLDFVWMGEDLGTQRGPMISMETYRRHVKPYHKMVIDLADSYGLKCMIHTCGSSSWCYNEMIEMGMRGFDALQPEAYNMSMEYLKTNFGGRAMFHSGISTTGKLSFGTADDVEAEVKRTLEIMMPGGGYICAPSHQIQDNTPTENVLRLYETAKKYGRY